VDGSLVAATGEPRFCKDEEGFTLPEVMIVIVLMGILFGIASSTWFGVVESRRVDAATNQVLSDLRLAHTSSTNRLTEYRVAYVPGGQINCAGFTDADYCMLQQTGGSYQQKARYLPERTEISSTNLGIDSTIVTLLGSADARTVRFSADGAAESGGGLVSGSDIRVTVASDDGAPCNVLDVNPATARVKVSIC
jgi:prepilin-type N-terminal cleavage/methylation domain-containing protein